MRLMRLASLSAAAVLAGACASRPAGPPLDLADDGLEVPHVVKNSHGETLLYNFRSVERGVLYRGSEFTRALPGGAPPGPDAQPIAFKDEQTFLFLRSRNIRHVVSLAATSDFYPEEGYLRYWTERMDYAVTATSLPVEAADTYARNHRSGLHAAAELLALMKRRRPEDGAVLVHGEAGMDATGIAAAAYELWRSSSGAEQDATWRQVLRRYLLSNSLLADDRGTGTPQLLTKPCAGGGPGYVCPDALEALRRDLLFLARL